MCDKRQREENWSSEEKNLLVEQASLYINYIENRKVDSGANIKKKEAWMAISNAFKARGFKRNHYRIKEQWKRLKVTTKINEVMGGRLPKYIEERDNKIKKLIESDKVVDKNNFDYDMKTNSPTISYVEPGPSDVSSCPSFNDECTYPAINYTSPSSNTFSLCKEDPLAQNADNVCLDNIIESVLIKQEPLQIETETASHNNNEKPVEPKQIMLQNHPKAPFAPVDAFRTEDDDDDQPKQMSTLEAKSLELYAQKIKVEIQHAEELHSFRKKWEEKIYKLKYNLLKQRSKNIQHSDSE